MSQAPGTVHPMLSTSGRQRAERSIRRALPGGQSPGKPKTATGPGAGADIHWADWFRLWRRIASESRACAVYSGSHGARRPAAWGTVEGMRTVLVGSPPAEVEAWLERRRQLGLDRFDEVWEGESHVV